MNTMDAKGPCGMCSTCHECGVCRRTGVIFLHVSADLSGYWVLSKTEHFDEFLKALGVPWIVRKAAIKFGSNAMEIIRHAGTAVRVTSLNPKGSWHRMYDTSKALQGQDVAGNACTIRAKWDGSVLCTTLEGSPFGTCETHRYVRGSTMVVKSSVKNTEGVEATCYWWYERMEVLEREFGPTRRMLHKHLAADQKRVDHATKKDTIFMRSILLDWNRWESPADEYIVVNGSKARRRSVRSRQRSPASSATCTPGSMSASPSGTALNKMGKTEQQPHQEEVSAILSQKPTDHARHPLPVHPVKRAASPGLQPEGVQRGMTRRFGSSDNLSETSIQRIPHYRSTSSDSLPNVNIGQKSREVLERPPPTAAEAMMAMKLHEFVETYGITSVIPVVNPHDTTEPQLLGMSPEQAEETTAKLRELETEMLLRRQEESNSFTFCGLVVSLERDTIPDHLRVWEMTLF